MLQVRAPSEAFRLLYTTLMNWLRLEAPKRKQDPLWGQMAEEAVAESKVHGLLGSERLAMQRMWNAHQVRCPTNPSIINHHSIFFSYSNLSAFHRCPTPAGPLVAAG